MSPLREQGFRAKKTGFPLEFIPHTMRGGNDKYCFRNSNYLAGQTRKAEESQMQGKAEDISLDFWAQKVYRFLVVVNSVLKESIGAIWFNEEDSHLSSFWW